MYDIVVVGDWIEFVYYGVVLVGSSLFIIVLMCQIVLSAWGALSAVSGCCVLYGSCG